MGSIVALTNRGDEPIIEWNPEDPAEVKKAKAEWDRLKKEGFEFFEPQTTKGKRVTRFDKTLGRVIASPGVQSKADKKDGRRGKAMAGGPNDLMLGRL